MLVIVTEAFDLLLRLQFFLINLLSGILAEFNIYLNQVELLQQLYVIFIFKIVKLVILTNGKSVITDFEDFLLKCREHFLELWFALGVIINTSFMEEEHHKLLIILFG